MPRQDRSLQASSFCTCFVSFPAWNQHSPTALGIPSSAHTPTRRPRSTICTIVCVVMPLLHSGNEAHRL